MDFSYFHSITITRDLKGLRVNSPCDNLFQTAIDMQDTLSHFHVFSLRGTLTHIHIATENLLNASCSEILFISHIYPVPTLSLVRQVGLTFSQLFTREKQEIVLISRS